MKNYSERFPTKTRKIGDDPRKHQAEKRRLTKEYQKQEAEQEIKEYVYEHPIFPDND